MAITKHLKNIDYANTILSNNYTIFEKYMMFKGFYFVNLFQKRLSIKCYFGI